MGAPNLEVQFTYQWHEGNGYRALKLWGSLEPQQISKVETEFCEHQTKAAVHLVVNLENVSLLHPDWLRFLLRLQATLKKTNHALRLIKVSPAVASYLKKNGVDGALKVSSDLRGAQVDLGLINSKRLNTDFINPFLESVIVILKSYQVDSKPGKPYLKNAGEKFTGDLSGVIGITSESFSGSVVMSFPEKTFLSVMSSMLQENFTTISDEILDGAGEITNQVFGKAKTILNEKGYGIKTAIPSVVAGKDHSLTTLTTGPTVVVPFTSTAGDFFIEICLTE